MDSYTGMFCLLGPSMIGTWGFTNFFCLLYSIKINRDGEDRVHWLPARSGSFEVKSFTSPYYPTDPSLPMEK